MLAGTWATHLVGGSAGREGVALQMSGSLTDALARVRLRPDDRRMLLVTALAGGFGAVFGVPLAGAVFALEVQSIGRVRYEALGARSLCCFVGERLVRALGHDHAARLSLTPEVDFALLGKVALAGLAFRADRRGLHRAAPRGAGAAGADGPLAAAAAGHRRRRGAWPRVVY